MKFHEKQIVTIEPVMVSLARHCEELRFDAIQDLKQNVYNNTFEILDCIKAELLAMTAK